MGKGTSLQFSETDLEYVVCLGLVWFFFFNCNIYVI